MVRNVGFYYFSPTGGTRETGELFCRAAAESVKKIDLMKKGSLRTQILTWWYSRFLYSAAEFRRRQCRG